MILGKYTTNVYSIPPHNSVTSENPLTNILDRLMIDTLTLRFLAEPSDVNFGGKVHGGAVMKWIDQAGYACAAQWCGTYAVTIYVGGIRFLKPIHIGSLVEIRSRLILTGRTSMHIAVDVFSKRPEAETYIHNTHCIIVFVAVDTEGKPSAVAPFTPTTHDGIKLQQYAQRLMELRAGIEAEMAEFLA